MFYYILVFLFVIKLTLGFLIDLLEDVTFLGKKFYNKLLKNKIYFAQEDFCCGWDKHLLIEQILRRCFILVKYLWPVSVSLSIWYDMIELNKNL